MRNVLVLMATYNGERFLNEQIESVLSQEKVQVSLLIRDDGSTDNTTQLLEKWAKKDNVNWYQGKHLNVPFGFYELMEKASKTDFDYISLCDQDDVWDKDKLIAAVHQLDKLPQRTLKLYYCGQRIVDEQCNVLSVHQLNLKRSMRARFLLSDIAGCTAVFNKELLKAVMEYKPNYMLMHDTWLLKVCLSLGGSVIVDPDAHMNYRQHGNNAVGLGTGLLAKVSRAKKYIYDYKIEKQVDELQKGYEQKITPEYSELISYIKSYKTNTKNKNKLMDKNYINFCNSGINITYHLKILLKRL